MASPAERRWDVNRSDDASHGSVGHGWTAICCRPVSPGCAQARLGIGYHV